jgi:DNA-binding transcriptional ArsR family regulator
MDISASERLDATFLALADPTRRGILARLARGEASVTELAEPFAISQPAISKHLKVLERAGLITVGQDAQRRPRRFEGKRLAEASAWLERYRAIWEANFERLDGVLEELQAGAPAARGMRGGVERGPSPPTHTRSRPPSTMRRRTRTDR